MLNSTKTFIPAILLLAFCACGNQNEINALKARIIKNQDDSGHLVRQNHLESRAIAVIKVQMDSLDVVDQALRDSTRAVYRLSPFASEYIYGQHNSPPLTLRDLIELDSAKIIRPLIVAGFQWAYAKCCQFTADTVGAHYKRLDKLKKASQDKRDYFQKQNTNHKNKITDNTDKIDSLGKALNRQRDTLKNLL